MDSSHSHPTQRMASSFASLLVDTFTVLLAFLGTKDLLKLDSALTDRDLRDKYLDALSKIPIEHLLERELLSKTNWEWLFSWLCLRGAAALSGVASKTLILPFEADDYTLTLLSKRSATRANVEEVVYDCHGEDANAVDHLFTQSPDCDCMITATGMAVFAHLPRLRVLRLKRIPEMLTCSSLVHISELPIEVLDLNGCGSGGGITRLGMNYIAALSCLKYLDILDSFGPYPGALEVLANCKTLESLKVSLNYVTDNELKRFSDPASPLAKTLTALHIANIDEITNDGIAHLARGFKKLLSLITICKGTRPGVTGACLKHIAEHLTCLQRLEVGFTSMSDADLEFLGRMKSLVYVTVLSYAFTGSGLAFLKSIQSLREVTVFSDGFTAEGLESLQHLHMLTKFDIRTIWGALTGEMMAKIRHLASLKHLIWMDNPLMDNPNHHEGITDESLAALSELNHLESLELFSCRKITKEGLFGLAKACPTLKHISIGPFKKRRDLAKTLARLGVSVSFYGGR